MMRSSLGTKDRAAAWVLVLAMALVAGRGFASVQEAHSFAMEGAEAHVKDGFSLRGEPWTGRLAPGGRAVLKHQLFRGNEYWFWLGTPTSNAKLTVKIYDRKGRPVHVETKTGDRWSAARVLPPKTGTYIVVVTAPAESKKVGEAFDWSLSYGFR